MKKSILFASALLIASLCLAGNEKYYENMGKTLRSFSECQSVDDYQALAGKFHIIADAEKNEWLPLYYEAYAYVLMTFVDGVKALDKDVYLDQAKPILEKLMEKSPDNAEVLTLQAFWYTSRLVVDPPSRSMNLQPLIARSLAMALAIEPGHPRALFMRISNDMGTAAFFGSDTTPYCEEARELLENWDNYEPASPIHPTWGKQEVEGIVSRCGQ